MKPRRFGERGVKHVRPRAWRAPGSRRGRDQARPRCARPRLAPGGRRSLTRDVRLQPKAPLLKSCVLADEAHPSSGASALLMAATATTAPLCPRYAKQDTLSGAGQPTQDAASPDHHRRNISEVRFRLAHLCLAHTRTTRSTSAPSAALSFARAPSPRHNRERLDPRGRGARADRLHGRRLRGRISARKSHRRLTWTGGDAAKRKIISPQSQWSKPPRVGRSMKTRSALLGSYVAPKHLRRRGHGAHPIRRAGVLAPRLLARNHQSAEPAGARNGSDNAVVAPALAAPGFL